jgi:hypothetical protein
VFEKSGVCGQFASGGGDYSGQKKAAQLMPDVDALWTASRGKIQDGSTRILLLVDFELIQINKCRFDCARVPISEKRPWRINQNDRRILHGLVILFRRKMRWS